MRQLPWGVLSLVTIVGGLNLVFVGCGSEESDDVNATDDGGDGSSSGSTSSSSGTASSSSSGSSGTGDGGGDGSADSGQTCRGTGEACAKAADCCSLACLSTGQCGIAATVDGGNCKPPAATCQFNTDCCTGSCVAGSCSATPCKADTPVAEACTTDAQCCSGKCDTGTKKCTAVAGGSCRTDGNPCTSNLDCCSQQCNSAGRCGNLSFCTQLGDICANDFECCGGLCSKASAGDTYGRCALTAGPSGGCNPTGTICTADGCDNKCCSKSCGPYGSTGVNICQPPSGCRPKYEICQTDDDCCGGPDLPQGANYSAPVKCEPSPRPDPYGRCDKANKCNPPGDTCKVDGFACGIDNRCCEPYFPDGGKVPPNYCQNNPDHCCSFDALGIPRCHAVAVGCDKGAIPAGTTCATSADCCGKPCVDNKCEGTCVAKGGECTVSADCCSPEPCVVPTGSTKGICGGVLQPDGGVTPPPPDAGVTDASTTDASTPPPCTLYGQTCTKQGECCSGVPCTAGFCRFP